MPQVVDPRKMYLFFGALGEHRPVTIYSWSKSGATGTLAYLEKAIRGKVKWSVMQQLSAAYVKPECMYSIPIEIAPGPWKPGDRLVDYLQEDATDEDGGGSGNNGVTYVVQHAEHDEGFWLLTCFNPKLSFRFQDYCNILQISETFTGQGTRIATLSELYSNQPCRIQPSSSQFAIAHGRVGDRKTFDVFLAEDYDLFPSRHLIEWASADYSGNYYQADILDIQQRESFDQLMRITVELRPGSMEFGPVPVTIVRTSSTRLLVTFDSDLDDHGSSFSDETAWDLNNYNIVTAVNYVSDTQIEIIFIADALHPFNYATYNDDDSGNAPGIRLIGANGIWVSNFANFLVT